MTYTGNELAALVHIGVLMAAADGHVDDLEQFAIAKELSAFGVEPNQLDSLLVIAKNMQTTGAIVTLSGMSNEQKRYACGYLAAIMASDGDIADSELKLWKFVCTLASFPTMTFAEALSFWTTH